MTIEQIRQDVIKHKPCSKAAIHGYLKKLKIKPLGELRQRPQRYPEDSAARILLRLGFNGKSITAIPSLNHLRAERRKAQTTRRAA